VTLSRAELASLPPDELQRVLETLEIMQEERDSGKVPWLCTKPGCDGSPHAGRPGPHARPNQRMPGPESEYDVMMALAGRGFGKTRMGAEWSWRMAKQFPGSRGALVGATAADARDTLVEGESGIIACCPASFRPLYEPSKRRLTWPNGSQAAVYSADEPDRLRGPQHHWAWADELAAWKRLQYAWDMLQMTMRLGEHPQVLISTTPRPLPLIKELNKDPLCYVVRGSTYDNIDNLAPTFRRAVVARYEGTTLGRQELDAEILDDMPGALLSRPIIERNRVTEAPADVLLRAVAMDPAGTGLGDETGLIAGLHGADGNSYITHDWSEKLTPDAAANRAWALFEATNADVLVYEDNFGKGWLKEVLTNVWKKRNPGKSGAPPLQAVWASHGKKLRAQPVVMRYEQDKVKHVGVLEQLESQYTTWIPEEDNNSPDRVDAAVHLVTHFAKRFGHPQASIASPHLMMAGRSAHISPAAMGRMGRPPTRRI
jgi:phage terminase large subunit-like protein